MPTRDSHLETMAKKAVRAQIGLLRDDWFLPVQNAAIDKALVYVGEGLSWEAASRRALDETYADYKIQGLSNLVGDQAVIEANASTPKE